MRIALVGSAPASVHIAPYEDKSYQTYTGNSPMGVHLPPWVNEEWEIWGCSPGAAQALRRCSRFFEVHRWEPGKPWFHDTYIRYLKEFRGQVYMGAIIPEIPNCVPYPIERVEETFSSYFLSSSVALMFALAILEIEDLRAKDKDHDQEHDVIGLWGIDMAACEEWEGQKYGCQFFVLEALRRNIGVYVPPESCLLRPRPVYGLCEWDHNYIKLTQRSRELNTQRSEALKQLEELRVKVATVDGCQQDLEYMVNTWTSPYGLPAGEILRMKRDKFPTVATDERLDHLNRENQKVAMDNMIERTGVATE